MTPRPSAFAVVLVFVTLSLATLTACGHPAPLPPPMDPGQAQVAAEPSVAALRRGDFTAAAATSGDALRANGGNAIAAAVHALATYQHAGEQVRDQFMTILDRADGAKRLDHAAGRAAWEAFGTALAQVDADLAIAERDPTFSLELCLACWTHDWNHTGEIDDGDRLLMQVEVDTAGTELPPDDPRRSPTFRFDTGDIAWARAMVAFQRAAIELVLAYRWEQLDRLANDDDGMKKLTIELIDAGRVHRARDLIRAGLAFSDHSRELYLAETDDDREWVPNPRQTSHPVPLVMDDAMYATWAAVTRDVRALIDGKEGLDIGEILGMGAGKLGFVDVGRLLEDPHDFTIDPAKLDDGEGPGILSLARQVLGPAIVDRKARSPLVARMLRMMREMDSDQDTFGHKLRYFLWIN